MPKGKLISDKGEQKKGARRKRSKQNEPNAANPTVKMKKTMSAYVCVA
jgi:hypothetical protein